MKTIFQYSIILIVLMTTLGVGGCKKDEIERHYTAKGRILQKGTNTPVEGVRISIQGCSFEDGTEICAEIDAVYTNSNGEYLVDVDDSDGFIYQMVLKKEGYLFSDAIPLLNYGLIEQDYFMEAKGFLKVHIKNINPFDANDLIRYGNYEYIGANIDTTITNNVLAGTLKGTYYYIKNNEFKSVLYEVEVPALDTAYYEILY